MVSGASGKIGEAICRNLLYNGYAPIGICRTQPQDVGVDIPFYPLDLSAFDTIEPTVSEIVRDHGQIYGLINCAGSIVSQHSMLLPARAIKNMVDVNVLGTMLLAREVAKRMALHRTGRIVFFGSMASFLNPSGDAVYAITKSATVAMAENFSAEFFGLGITCNCLVVTATGSGMAGKIDEEALQKIISRLPSKSRAKIEEILNVVNFFLEENSASVSGQTISLGGLRV